jgi:hypothetical protein
MTRRSLSGPSPLAGPRATPEADDMSSAGVEWRRNDLSIAAVRDRTLLGTVRWVHARPSEVDLVLDLEPHYDPEVACALLDRALAELGGRGVPKVRLTLTAGEPQTPRMLQIVRGQSPAAASAPFVAGAEIHAAGQSALVDVALQPYRRPSEDVG